MLSCLRIDGSILKKGLTSLAVLVLLVLSGTAQSESVSVAAEPMTRRSPSAQMLGDIDESIAKDPLVQELISIADDFLKRLLSADSEVLAQIGEAYQLGDEAAITSLLGYSPQELAEIERRLDNAREGILAKYPEIRLLVESGSACPCLSSDCKAKVNDFLSQLNAARKDESVLRDYKCRWIPYTACLAVCTTMGPAGYFFCSVVCTCSFCEGGVIDRICDW